MGSRDAYQPGSAFRNALKLNPSLEDYPIASGQPRNIVRFLLDQRAGCDNQSGAYLFSGDTVIQITQRLVDNVTFANVVELSAGLCDNGVLYVERSTAFIRMNDVDGVRCRC